MHIHINHDDSLLCFFEYLRFHAVRREVGKLHIALVFYVFFLLGFDGLVGFEVRSGRYTYKIHIAYKLSFFLSCFLFFFRFRVVLVLCCAVFGRRVLVYKQFGRVREERKGEWVDGWGVHTN